MTQPTALQRAFTLARTGDYQAGAIKAQLRVEGFDVSQLYGSALILQLQQICASAQDAAGDDWRRRGSAFFPSRY